MQGFFQFYLSFQILHTRDRKYPLTKGRLSCFPKFPIRNGSHEINPGSFERVLIGRGGPRIWFYLKHVLAFGPGSKVEWKPETCDGLLPVRRTLSPLIILISICFDNEIVSEWDIKSNIIVSSSTIPDQVARPYFAVQNFLLDFITGF